MESNLNELFSELFAYRILLQDSYENESDIIREIKNYLIEIGISLNNIPQIIHEFYKTYGFEISLDVVNQVCINPIVNNIFSFTLSSDDEIINVYNPFLNHNQVQEELSNEESDDEQQENINMSGPNLQQMASDLLNINNSSLNQQMAQNMFQYINFVNGNLQNNWINNPVNNNYEIMYYKANPSIRLYKIYNKSYYNAKPIVLKINVIIFHLYILKMILHYNINIISS